MISLLYLDLSGSYWELKFPTQCRAEDYDGNKNGSDWSKTVTVHVEYYTKHQIQTKQ